MATAQINFTERALDAWVSNTLAGYRTDPSSIPSDGDAWIRDRGGKQSVPGLCLRIRLKKKGGNPTLDDPIIAFYLVRKIQGKKRALRIGERKVFTIEMARDKTLEELRNLEQGVDQRVERKREAAKLANEQAVAKGAAVPYGQVLDRFLEQADLSEGTRKNYLLGVTTTFKAHVDRPLSEFTETSFGSFTVNAARRVHRGQTMTSAFCGSYGTGQGINTVTWKVTRSLGTIPSPLH